jgi:serine/threonine protein kinase
LGLDLHEALALGQARGLADQHRLDRPFHGGGEAGDWTVPLEVPLEVTGGLGLGGYGVVVKARLQSSQTQIGGPARCHYALKAIAKATNFRPKDRDRLTQEIKVLTEVPPNPFLQRCHLAFETTADLFMVLDFVGGGDLFFHLEELTRAGLEGFPEPTAGVLLAELSLGLIHLHAGGFVHRDVKVENIMLDQWGHVKLVDFGLALPIQPTLSPAGGLELPIQPMSPTGSLIYMAPELLDSKIGGRFTDWWALGVVAHELLTGRSPWSTLTDKRQIRREIRGESVVRLPPHVSRDAAAFVGSLLTRDHRRRLGTPSDSEVLSAPFFRGIDWRAAASGLLAPAFVPREQAQSAGDRDEALRGYAAKLQPPSPPFTPPHAATTPWTLGLPCVAAAPPIAREEARKKQQHPFCSGPRAPLSEV